MDKESAQRTLKQFLKNIPVEKGKIKLDKLVPLYKKCTGNEITVAELEKKYEEVEKDKMKAPIQESFMDVFGKFFGIFEEVEEPLTPNQREILKKIFKICDIKGNGKIEKEGLKQGMDAYGTTFDDSQIDALYKILDPENIGYIEYNAFVRGMAPTLTSTDADMEEKLRQNLQDAINQKKRQQFEEMFKKKRNY